MIDEVVCRVYIKWQKDGKISAVDRVEVATIPKILQSWNDALFLVRATFS